MYVARQPNSDGEVEAKRVTPAIPDTGPHTSLHTFSSPINMGFSSPLLVNRQSVPFAAIAAIR